MAHGEIGQALRVPIEDHPCRDQDVFRVQRIIRVARLEQRRQRACHVFAQVWQAMQVVLVVRRAEAVLLKQFGVQQLVPDRGHPQPHR